MIKKFFLMLTVATFIMTFTSCGKSVDYSDPQSVAEAAIICYHTGDYKKLKTLCNPEDINGLKEMDKMIELSKKYKESHPDQQPLEVPEFSFEMMKETFSGSEVSSKSDDIIVQFKSDVYPRLVEVIKGKDGKWYFERFK